MINQPTMQKDCYKAFHQRAYHPDVTTVYCNYTNRSGKFSNVKDNDKVMFIGLQYFIKSYLMEEWASFFNQPKCTAVANHKRILSAMLGYEFDVTYLESLHDLGYLPLRIKALEEGTLVPYQVPCLTITNTVDGFQWLPNMIETALSAEIWGMQTSATTSLAYYKEFKHYAELTGADKELVKFQGHDFSFRGMFGKQAAAMSGFAHLCSGFVGTDTIPAVLFAEEYYNADVDKYLVGCSVNATEHSVTCSWKDEGEVDFIRHLMKENPAGILSVVSDTWDFWKLVTEYLPMLKDEIMARDGKCVIRPDSGSPEDILCGVEVNRSLQKLVGEGTDILSHEVFGIFKHEVHSLLFCRLRDQTPHGEYGGNIEDYFEFEGDIYHAKGDAFWDRYDKQYYYLDELEITLTKVELTYEQKGLIECLWDIFGGTINEKGYKVLDEHIGAIYGDAITLERQEKILKRLEEKGFSSSNVVLGIGSYSYQYVTRDTHGSAVKATSIVKNEERKAIFKDPKTDSGKKSHKGLLRVNNTAEGFTCTDDVSEEQEGGIMDVVFEDGKIIKEQSLFGIRYLVQEQIND